MKTAALTALTAALLLSASPGEARRLPGPTAYFGPNCQAIYRATGQPVLYVGTVLGGQNRRGFGGDGTYRHSSTYQGCFVSEAGCQAFLARNSAHHPLPPGYARCTPVYVGLTPGETGRAGALSVRY